MRGDMADTPVESEPQRAGLTEGARYQFRYALFSVLVELRGAQLLVKTSTKTQIIPRDSMRSLYAPIIRGESYRELIISYSYRGKLKRARLFSNLGQAQFERLLTDLSRPNQQATILIDTTRNNQITYRFFNR